MHMFIKVTDWYPIFVEAIVDIRMMKLNNVILHIVLRNSSVSY